jgi:ketosteroid isomerase-like protein
MNVEAVIRELADTEAIRDLARRYAHYVWNKDAAAAVSLFADDGVMDLGDRPAIKGRATLLESYQSLITDPSMHPFVHNHVFEVDGDRATGMCYLDLRVTLADGTKMIGFGYYNDVYVRVGPQWKFRFRKLTLCDYVPFPQPPAAAQSGS